MTELQEILEELGLSGYLTTFVNHGFDNWKSVADITEFDFEFIGIKVGDRRKIHRRIAQARGIASLKPLASVTTHTPGDDRQSEETKLTVSKLEPQENSSNARLGKRNYRRHPKVDENAPKSPPSAYVIFSNKVRDDLKGRHLSFIELAKLVGENWQALSPDKKQPYELLAANIKEKYNAKMAEYKQTDSFKKYTAYLVEFNEKHPRQEHALEAKKRAKVVRENGGKSGSNSSAAGYHSCDYISRYGSAGSLNSARQSCCATTAGEQSPQSGTSNLNASNKSATHLALGLPLVPPPATILPGYRDVLLDLNRQILAWQNNSRNAEAPQVQQLPRLRDIEERPTGHFGTGTSPFDACLMSTSQAFPRSFASAPHLTSQSISGTTNSLDFKARPVLHPRNPRESSFELSVQLQGMYSSNPGAQSPSYDIQQTGGGGLQAPLPPVRFTSSLSPLNTLLVPRNVIKQTLSAYEVEDTPTSNVSGRRGCMPNSQLPNARQTWFRPEEEALDPIAALLRAGEIRDRQGMRR